MRSERVNRTDPCGLVRRWMVDPVLADMLIALDDWASKQIPTRRVRGSMLRLEWPGLYVISGGREAPIVPDLNPNERAALNSRHLRCPSLAVDLRVGNQPASLTDPSVWTMLGLRWGVMGGRWGGSFSTPDYNHFDIDPLLAS